MEDNCLEQNNFVDTAEYEQATRYFLVKVSGLFVQCLPNIS